MKARLTVTAALLVALTITGGARPDADFSAERFKAHVTFLADDLLEGREAGTRGHEIAARYIASQFALLGVKPAAPDGTYFEPVSLLEAGEANPPVLVLRTPRGVQTLRHGLTVLVQPSVTAGAATVKGALVFAGYGMQDDSMGYDDYRGLDVRGKIAVVLRGSPKGMDSEIGAHLRSEQAHAAAEHGAVGVISVQTHESAKAFPWQMLRKRANERLTTWVRKDGTPFDPQYGLKATAIIDPTTAPALFDGAGTPLEQILAEADRPGGRPKGFALKSSATITLSTKVRRFSSPEVIGLIEGSDAALKNEYVALMAHADHIGVKASGTGDRINNGALDNAAGVATLLEVARAFMTAAERPRRSILIVANTAEEKGLLGAEYFARYPPVSIDRIVAAIDLDMPMLLYDFTDVVAYGVGHSTLEHAFGSATKAMNIKLSPDPMPEQAVFVRSDHYAMVKAGVPAVMLATGMDNGGAAQWNKFLSTNYHQPSDDLSQPIQWSAGAKFADLNYRVVRTLADEETRPRWYAGDYFGNLFAPTAPKAPKQAAYKP